MTARLRPDQPAGHRLIEGPDGEIVCRPVESDEFASSENVAILESWHSRRDPGLSVARARLLPGETTETHCLDRTTERYLIVKGSGIVHIGALGPVRVGPGDVVFIPPRVSQRISNAGESDLVFYCLCTPAFDAGDYRRLDHPASGRDDG
jgi:mannose-6-phosphate isomerase-like protein (cupin superfamily)